MNTKKWSFKITFPRIILLALVAFTAILAVFRLYTGLGVSTNLNDNWPWGLWIIVDLTAIALAGAGYSITVLVYVLNLEKYKPVARRALLFSLVSYFFVLLTLILEIGRWDNFWRPFHSWGYHSPMFEVYMCIVGYVTVQLIEIAEIVTEKISSVWNKRIKKLMPVAVIIAALLPFGHQASLGAIYTVVPGKLHPLWYSPMLPWFFLITSFFVGPALMVLEALWSRRKYNDVVSDATLKGLVRISGVLMVIYLILKIIDLAKLNAFQYVFAGGFESNMFLLEMAIGVIIPIIICFSPLIGSKKGLISFGICAVIGIVLGRVNVIYTGMYNALGPGYTPNWIEWGISIGLAAFAILLYLFVIENFKIYNVEKDDAVYTVEDSSKGTTVSG